MKRAITLVVLVCVPLFAGTCTVTYPHPTLWQAVKLLWGITFGTCSQ